MKDLHYFELVQAEIDRAERLYPAWPPNIFEQMAVVNEEAGEATRAVLHYKRENGSLQDVKTELIQTCAVCIRMLKEL